MEKKNLTLSDLEVQSFATSGGATGERGTVRAHDAPTDQVECPTADVNWDTCWGSCGCDTNACTGIWCSDDCPRTYEDCTNYDCTWHITCT